MLGKCSPNFAFLVLALRSPRLGGKWLHVWFFRGGKKWLAKCRWHNPPLPCSGNVCFFYFLLFGKSSVSRVCRRGEERRGEISRPPLKSSWNEAEKILSPPPPFSHIPFRPGKPGEFPLFYLPACTGGKGDAFVMRPVLIPPPLFYLSKNGKNIWGSAFGEKEIFGAIRGREREREADMQNENTSPPPFLAMFWLFFRTVWKEEGEIALSPSSLLKLFFAKPLVVVFRRRVWLNLLSPPPLSTLHGMHLSAPC